jgi:hypothetical protein
MNQLKKVLTYSTSFLFLFSLLLFSNCSKDGNDENPNADLIGTWKTSTINVDLMIDGKTLSQFLIDGGASEAEAALIEDYFTTILETEVGDGEIQLKSDNTYIADFGSDSPDTGKWSYNASTKILTIDSDDPLEDNQEIKVKSISSSTLIIEQNEVVEEDLDDDGIDEQIDTTIEMTFTKS